MLIWLILFIGWGLLKEPIRKALIQAVRAFFVRKIMILVALMLTYTVALVLILRHAALWTTAQMTATIFWTVSVAFVALMNVATITEDEHYFKKSALEQIQLLAVFEFVVNVYAFSLLIELIVVPVLALIGGLLVIVESDKEYGSVKKLLNSILAVFGLAFILFTVYKILTDFEGFASSDTLRDFLVPALMSLAFLPFIYVIAIYVRYENLFLRLSFFIKDKELLGFTKKATFRALHFRLNLLNKWAREVTLLRPQNKEEVRSALEDFKTRTCKPEDA